jgi:hypothetical protein
MGKRCATSSRSLLGSFMQPHHNMRTRSCCCWCWNSICCDVCVSVCLCVLWWWLPWGCQASRSAGRRPQGQGWGQGILNCHSWKQTSHRRERGNKRQKYLDCCSSARIEYIHPVTSTRTWLDQAKAHQRASSYRGNFAGLVLVSIDKHRKAGCAACAAWKAQNAQYGARGYEDATPLARLSRPCRQGPGAALIGPSGS